MKKVISLITFIAVSLAMTSAFAADNASHTVTVDVQAINEVGITGGNVTLTVNTATAGGQPVPVSDATTANLDWTTNDGSKKITVATDLTTATYVLTVEAQGASGGTGGVVITLSDTAADLVTGISNTTGTADLAYEATATAADGIGSDVHTVTYTMIAGL